MIIIGHRGARGHAPENTLLSFATASAMGVDWIEFDVQRHPSGELLVFHDLSLERTTDGHGRLEEAPLATLLALNAGQGEGIPTLAQTLKFLCAEEHRHIGINIELKTADGTAAAVNACLQHAYASGLDRKRLLVSSFHHPELQQFHNLAPDIQVAPLLCGIPLDGIHTALTLGASHLNLSAEFTDPALIHAAHAAGLQVFCYTVNAPEEMKFLRNQGIDGIFTDYPDRALRCFGRTRD